MNTQVALRNMTQVVAGGFPVVFCYLLALYVGIVDGVGWGLLVVMITLAAHKLVDILCFLLIDMWKETK